MYKEFDYRQLLAQGSAGLGPLPLKDGRIDEMAKGDRDACHGAHPKLFLPGAGNAGIRGGSVGPLERGRITH